MSRIRQTAIAAALVGVLVASTAHAISGGTPAPDNTYGFMARLDDGDHACSGALVAPRWVITARACFPQHQQQPGVPAKPVTVTLNRAALSGTGGHVVHVAKLFPHKDLDVTLAQLDIPIFDATPVAISSTAPQPNETLRLAGYGRTSDSWIADRFTTADFTISALTDTAFTATSPTGNDTCKGDAGGPALRLTGDTVHLVGIHSTSWQHGCFDVTETRQGSVETRLDPVADWIRQHTSTVQTGPIVGPGGKCVDMSGSKISTGTKVQLSACADSDAQKWTLEPNGDIRGVPKCLDFGNGGPGWSVIQLLRCNNGQSQRWNRLFYGPIRAYHNCVYRVGPFRNPPIGSVQLREGCASEDDEITLMTPLEGPLRTNFQNDLQCVDLPNAEAKDGAQLWFRDCDKSAGQRWVMESDEGPLRHAYRCLGIDGTKTKVQISDCGAGEWTATDNGALMHKPSGKCITAVGGEGVQLQLETCNGAASQTWRLPI